MPLSVLPQLPDLRISENNRQVALVAVTCLVGVGVAAWAYLFDSESRLPLPPSPPTWRLLGHFQPRKHAFLTVAQWINEYGPLITIRSGTEKMVIIGRYKAAVDIMEKQGASVADRPRHVTAGEMLSGGLSIGFTRAGERFRRMRRALHTHLQPKASEAYEPLQMLHAKTTILDILNDPDNFQDHIMSYAASTIMKVTYGKTTPTSATDPDIQQVHHFFEVFMTVVLPGAYLADSIPWLQYIPWYGRVLKDEFFKSKQLYTKQLKRVRQQIQSNEDVGPSFMKYVLENSYLYGLTEDELAFLAGAFFGAGSDTTAVAISTVLMAAACFPEEQAKVQAEIDAVIGRHRVPTFADQQSLPRLGAFISEALRWRPSAANGFAHRTTQDVIWENYCIPAGTTVVGSHWAISRDPEVYPEPHSFKPQRWIDDEGHLREDLKFFIYGFGRRICPGRHLADRSVFINSILIFWAFQLTLDPTKPMDDMGFMGGAMPNHKPCPLVFKPRIPETEIRCMMENYPEVA